MPARLLLTFLLLLPFSNVLPADPAGGQVRSVIGNVVMMTPGGKTVPVTSETVIPPGNRILTKDDARVIIEWLPGAFSVLFPNTSVSASRLGAGKGGDGSAGKQVSLRLIKGSVFSHLSRNNEVADFSIRTPQGVASARGTDWIYRYEGNIGRVLGLFDTVEVTLPSGRKVQVPPLFEYTLGDPGVVRFQEGDIKTFLQEFRDAGLIVTLQDINDPHHRTFPGTSTSGYIITFAPALGDGFEFFIPRWLGPGEDRLHEPLREKPRPGSDYPHVPPASP